MIKATGREMIDLLAGLAYGFDSAEGLRETKALWEARLEARQFNVTKGDLVLAAREKGIKGAGGMRKRELIDEIERIDPDFFSHAETHPADEKPRSGTGE